MMTVRFVLVVLPGDDHVLMCYVNVCMMIVLSRSCMRMQMNGNKIIFMNVFNDLDACMHKMMMVSICKEE